jgi:hypothetical protein
MKKSFKLIKREKVTSSLSLTSICPKWEDSKVPEKSGATLRN